MALALSKTKIESELTTRFGDIFKLNEPRFAEVISTGIPEVDALTSGLPRGAITEIFGPASSGRTSLMLASLAYATTHDEVCALVDVSDTLDLKTAAQAGVDFDRLLWIRCTSSIEHAFKATDLLLQGGGFGLIMLDLGDVPGSQARRIISSWWYRFRRVVENKPTAMVVIAQDSCVRSCAAMTLEIARESTAWESMSEPLSGSYSHAVVPSSPQEIGPFSGHSFAVRGPHAGSPRGLRSTISDPTKSSSNLPTHSIILRRTGWLLERLKPVHFGERAVRFESHTS